MELQPRICLEGWDFRDFMMTLDPVYPRMAELEAASQGWVTFTRAINSITLFGCDFGDVILPSLFNVCSHWASLPNDNFYLAAHTADLMEIMDIYDGEYDSIPKKLTSKIFCHNPAQVFECGCGMEIGGEHAGFAQVILPQEFMQGVDHPLQKGAEWSDRGAVIFGHNAQSTSPWGLLCDEGEGELRSMHEQDDPTHREGGFGQSLQASDTEAGPLTPRCFTVGIVCALHKELFAVRELFDSKYLGIALPDEDSNHYVLGRIGQHNVAAACLPSGEYGTNSAASVVVNMKRTFTRIKFCLLVGIGGGVPYLRDIRLGDVVVSHPTKVYSGVIQYDLGADSTSLGFTRTGSLQGPSHFLRTALGFLTSDDKLAIRTQLTDSIKRTGDRDPAYSHPGVEKDILIKSFWVHEAGQQTCEQCVSHEVWRTKRDSTRPEIHYGTIASGNRLIRNGYTRDQLSRQYEDVLCVEMEAAGVMNTVDCLVIRGICDYADSHKNDIWQNYASATAAAFAKLFLSFVRPPRSSETRSVDSGVSSSRKRPASPIEDSFVERRSAVNPLVAFSDNMSGKGKGKAREI